VSPLRGEKPIFGPLSKNNTGMAALRAGLPVITNLVLSFVVGSLVSSLLNIQQHRFSFAASKPSLLPHVKKSWRIPSSHV